MFVGLFMWCCLIWSRFSMIVVKMNEVVVISSLSLIVFDLCSS